MATKDMSWLDTSRGGALVGAPRPPRIRKRSMGLADLLGSTFALVARKALAVEPKHKFSSTQFNLAVAGYSRSQGSPIPRLKELAASIPDEDLAEDGRESEYHVTVKYGLHADDPEDVRRVVRKWLASRRGMQGGMSVTAMLAKVSIFPAKEASTQRGGDQHDVVKVDVESDDLQSLNKAISALPHTDTHPVYKPHVTLAYVKAGLGKKYVGRGLGGHTVLMHALTFSVPSGEKTVIDLWKED